MSDLKVVSTEQVVITSANDEILIDLHDVTGSFLHLRLSPHVFGDLVSLTKMIEAYYEAGYPA